jgi:hypothetical protein
VKRGTEFVEFTPEVKNNCPFRNTISATIYQDFIGGDTFGLLDRSRIFGWNDVNVSVVELGWSVDFNYRIGIGFRDSAFEWLGRGRVVSLMIKRA